MSDQSSPPPLVGIDPRCIYPESELRKVIEVSALRRAKRQGLKHYRLGRTAWVLGQDLIEYLQGQARRHQAIDAPAPLLTYRCDRCDQPISDYTVFELPHTGRVELCSRCAKEQAGPA